MSGYNERQAFKAAVIREKVRIRVHTEALAQIAREDAAKAEREAEREAAWLAEQATHDAACLISVEPS